MVPQQTCDAHRLITIHSSLRFSAVPENHISSTRKLLDVRSSFKTFFRILNAIVAANILGIAISLVSYVRATITVIDALARKLAFARTPRPASLREKRSYKCFTTAPQGNITSSLAKTQIFIGVTPAIVRVPFLGSSLLVRSVTPIGVRVIFLVLAKKLLPPISYIVVEILRTS